MPYVNIRITNEGVITFVVIDEVDTDNWGRDAILEAKNEEGFYLSAHASHYFN